MNQTNNEDVKEITIITADSWSKCLENESNEQINSKCNKVKFYSTNGKLMLVEVEVCKGELKFTRDILGVYRVAYYDNMITMNYGKTTMMIDGLAELFYMEYDKRIFGRRIDVFANKKYYLMHNITDRFSRIKSLFD